MPAIPKYNKHYNSVQKTLSPWVRIAAFFRLHFAPIPKEFERVELCGIPANNSTYGLFPRDIWICIFSFLDVDDLIKVQLVSKQWYKLANSNQFWKPLYFKYLRKTSGFYIEEEEPIDEGYYKSLYCEFAEKYRQVWTYHRRNRNKIVVENIKKGLVCSLFNICCFGSCLSPCFLIAFLMALSLGITFFQATIVTFTIVIVLCIKFCH